MGIRIVTAISLTVCVASASASLAHAAVTVLGRGLARECYLAVEHQRISLPQGLQICTRALAEERLDRHDLAGTFTNRGILEHRSGHHDRAINDYRRSLETVPDLAEAHINLGVTLFSLKRYADALAAFDAGLKTASIEILAYAHYNRALAHEQLGDLHAAYRDFSRALEIDPAFSAAASQLTRFTVTRRGS